MVLETLFNPFKLKTKPYQMFFAGFIYSIAGMILSYFVFREIAGILMVFLIVLAALPILYTTIKNEEELDLKSEKEWFMLKEHTKVLVFLMFFFFGITTALILAYVTLPTTLTSTVFNLQEQAILNVNNYVQGGFTGYFFKAEILGKIFLNNLKVMFFCLIFSLLYGTGAIFILTWNASVIAVAIGSAIRSELGSAAAAVGWVSITSYFSTTVFSFFRYMTHGIFEIAAYFIAGLAGGIISIALIKHNLKNEKVFIDALDMILISVGILLFASLVEVYITPVLFH
ncbi:MAG: stage II sporulation protein M [Candidatus Woesearchaeota archaeon]